MTQKTLGELVDALDDEVKNRRSEPDSYDEELTDLYEEAAARLRQMDGERIEGWARRLANKRDFYLVQQRPVNPISNSDVPATLIIHAPQEQSE